MQKTIVPKGFPKGERKFISRKYATMDIALWRYCRDNHDMRAWETHKKIRALVK